MLQEFILTCSHCGSSYTVKGQHPARTRKYCSNKCVGAASEASRTLAERVWAKVDQSGHCWTWTGKKRTGYGRIYRHGRWEPATHAVWEVVHGTPVPPGMIICHHCDNPPCVRPDHLFLGTHADNVADRDRKHRRATPPRMLDQNGSKNLTAKLTDDQVREIRTKYATGNFRQIDLGREYGVSKSLIGLIYHRKCWTHI